MIADLRIKQEPVIVTDRESSDKLVEKSSGEVYLGGRGFEATNYGLVNEHKLNITSFKQSAVQLSHPPTPDLSPAPTTPARWNSKINKAGTVSTPDGKSYTIYILTNSNSYIKITITNLLPKSSNEIFLLKNDHCVSVCTVLPNCVLRHFIEL